MISNHMRNKTITTMASTIAALALVLSAQLARANVCGTCSGIHECPEAPGCVAFILDKRQNAVHWMECEAASSSSVTCRMAWNTHCWMVFNHQGFPGCKSDVPEMVGPEQSHSSCNNP